VIPLVTPAEMGAADARTIAAGTPEPVLMTRAGRAVAWRVRAVLGGTYGRRVVVVCGKGNNGGDGVVAADALRAWGVAVEVLRLDDDRSGARATRAVDRADLAVDAMFGRGFRGTLDGTARALADAVADAGLPVVAVDIPSGVDGLTGEVRGTAVRADHTVTFAAPKPGVFFHPGRALAGTVHVADIGIDLGPHPFRTALVEDADVASWVPDRDATTHKWRSGVLVIGGSAGMTGAPMLAAHAASHLGAGIVIAILPGDAATRASGTEVITHAVPAGASGGITRAAVAELTPDLDRFGAVVLGPGLGRGDEIASTVAALVRVIPGPLVLDADALVALGTELTPVRERSAVTILTPHDGEFERLTGARPGADRIAAARGLAEASGAVVLLKGPTSVVAAPDGRVLVNRTGTADLATAGSGDVLTGMIAAFCARGVEPLEAAAAAAFVHGRAAESGGHTGFVATDLPALAGGALRRISTL
jgi:NAD(P)H-hydrate epimerase